MATASLATATASMYKSVVAESRGLNVGNRPKETNTTVDEPAVTDHRVHNYNSTRFGSQQHLLDLLERSRQSDQTVQEILDSLVEQG